MSDQRSGQFPKRRAPANAPPAGPTLKRPTVASIRPLAVGVVSDHSSKWLIISGIVGGSFLGIITISTILILVLSQTRAPRPAKIAMSNELASRAAPVVEMPSVLENTEDSRDTGPSSPVPIDDVFDDVQHKGRVLTLPKREQGLGTSNVEQELCKIFVKAPTDLELNLLTAEILSDGRPRLSLKKIEHSIGESVESWTAFAQGKDSFQNEIEREIGWFRLSNQSLSFEWNTDTPAWTSPLGLQFCKLDLKAGSHMVQCSLTSPERKPIERISFLSRKMSLPTELIAGTLVTDTAIRYDIELRLDDWMKLQSGRKAKEKLTFEIPSDSKSEDTRVDLEVDFQLPTPSRPAQFNYAGFIYLNFAKSSLASSHEKFNVVRCDSVDDSMKDGVCFQDLLWIRKKVEGDQKKGKLDLSKAIKELERRKDAREQAKVLGDDLKFSDDAVTAQQKVIETIEDFIARGAETVRLTEALELRLKTIEASLEVRFRLYLEFVTGSLVEKVVLVETKPAPSD